MARGVNKVILLGHVGKDPDIKILQSGNAVANFSVATGEAWKDKQTGEAKDVTEWHRIVAYNKLAEIIGDYVKSGDKIYLEGKIKSRKYEKDGIEHYVTEILCSEIQMLGSKNHGSAKQSTQENYEAAKNGTAKSAKSSQDSSTPPSVFNDDIPL